MRADVLKRGLVCPISDCTVDPVSAFLVIARTSEVDLAVSDFVGWFLYDSKDAAVIFLLEWQRKNLKFGL